MAQIGDIVRYLNAIGGGRITRIEGNMAFVDEDGFETPVLLRECVVVANAGSHPSTTAFVAPSKLPRQPSTPKQQPAAPSVSLVPVVADDPIEVEEIEGNDRLNVIVAFEPVDIRRLSETTFDIFIVNDSNYFLAYSLIMRSDGDNRWSQIASGVIEPNIQQLVAPLSRNQFPAMDRLALQYFAYKVDAPFELKHPGFAEVKVDTTKFCKLHCFAENVYFDTRVLAFEMINNDEPRRREKLVDAKRLQQEMQQKRRADRRQVVRRQVVKHSERRNGNVIEVDLHIDMLIDNTRGMSNADILNCQIDEFTRVMDANLRNHGQKIVFIHGKGEGVLRQALMKELNHRYKGHDVQDASFQEYGYGATQVTIR